MKQHQFETLHQKTWTQMEAALAAPKVTQQKDFPARYRSLCHHFALAKHRRYSPQLIARLNALVLKAHHHFYEHKDRYRYQFIRFIVRGFPQALRNSAAFVMTALLLFVVPGLIMAVLCYLDDTLIYSLMSATSVRQFEALYDPAARVLGRARESDTDFFMFGFYIKNNIGVAFQSFAGGILYGIGTVFFLVYNGLMLGATAGHLSQLGYTQTFYSFVIGHGSFELTAIVFSGAAGLKLGKALISPQPFCRADALRNAGRDAIQIIYGAIIMLLIAAFLEAFWSSSTQISATMKYAVGSGLWLLVLLYCLFSGKNNGSQLH